MTLIGHIKKKEKWKKYIKDKEQSYSENTSEKQEAVESHKFEKIDSGTSTTKAKSRNKEEGIAECKTDRMLRSAMIVHILK